MCGVALHSVLYILYVQVKCDPQVSDIVCILMVNPHAPYRYMEERGDVPATWLNYFTDDGHTYNGHHFWSNFEIADVRFFAGEEYQSYFEYLDKDGGFFYERWGDAPVHSLGLGLWAQKSQVCV